MAWKNEKWLDVTEMLNRTSTPRVSKLNLQLTDISVKLSVTSLQEMFSHNNAEEKTIFKSPTISCLMQIFIQWQDFFFFFGRHFEEAVSTSAEYPKCRRDIYFKSPNNVSQRGSFGRKSLERVLNSRAAASQDRELFFSSSNRARRLIR